jgi:DNA-binding transcriptional ArsR family regulator
MPRDTRPATGRRVVEDLDALRVLAHPERAAILKLLMSGRPRTATECSGVVGASPSACSYHLRQLERFGFVERDDSESADGRMRHWKAAAVGFALGTNPLSDATPTERAVYAAVMGADRIENERLARQFVEHVDELPAEWQDAAIFATFELLLAPDELDRIGRAIDDLLRPHRIGVKPASPADPDARAVHVTLEMFPRSDEA